MYQNRYDRAAIVIRASLKLNGCLPTEKRLIAKCKVGAPTARYLLTAWNAYHAAAPLSTDKPNRYQRAAWAIRHCLNNSGDLPAVDTVALLCNLSNNIAHACLAAWVAFKPATATA